MKKKASFFFLLAIIIVLQLDQSSSATTIPVPEGDIYVHDFVNILSTDEVNELVELGRYIEDQTGVQIGVLIVETLGNKTLEDYALEAFYLYGLGEAEKNNGVLLLIAMNERKIRIEVGYGLEESLPDGTVGKILDAYTLPYLEENNIASAILNTYKQLINEIAAAYQLDLRTDAKGYEYGYQQENQNSHSIFLILTFLLLFGGLIIIDLRFFRGTVTFTILRLATRRRAGDRVNQRK